MAIATEFTEVVSNQEIAPEARIWQAVLVSTIEEWMSGPERDSREAEEFLFRNTNDFSQVCESAGMDPRRLRERLVRLRNKLNLRPESNLSRN